MTKSITVLTFALLLFATGPGAAVAQDHEVAGDASIEAELHELDVDMVRDRELDLEAPTVAAYAELLGRVDAKCPEDQDMLRDLVVLAQRILKQEGHHVFTWTILLSTDGFLDDEDTPDDVTCVALVEGLMGRIVHG